MALVTTFATTPLVTLLYPPEYQKKIEAWKRGEIDWDGNNLRPEGGDDSIQKEKLQAATISKITVLLRLENLPGIFAFVDLLGGKPVPKAKVHRSKAIQSGTIYEKGEHSGETSRSATPDAPSKRPLAVHGERLMELTQRTSAVMQVSELDELQQKDPVVNVFRTFGAFHNVAVSASVSIAPEDSFAEVITSRASAQSSDLLIIPWTETGAVTEPEDPTQYSPENRFMSHKHNQFITSVLERSDCSTAIMVNRGFGSNLDRVITRTASFRSMRSRKAADIANVYNPISDPSHHIFFPYFGGIDDRVALRFVLQLATNINVTATIVQVIYSSDATPDPELELPAAAAAAAAARPDLPRNLSLSHVPSVTVSESASRSTSCPTAAIVADSSFQSMQDSLPHSLQSRVLFETVQTPKPLHYIVAKAKSEVGQSTKNAGDLVILGRGLKEARPYIRTELVDVLSSMGAPSGAGIETRKCLGDVAETCIVANIKASVIVFQAGGRSLERDTEQLASKTVEDD